jgi:hypothetical protein
MPSICADPLAIAWSWLKNFVGVDSKLQYLQLEAVVTGLTVSLTLPTR